MTSLATELKDLIAKRIANASPVEMHTIVSSLCNEPAPAAQQCGIEPQWEAFDDVWNIDRASGLYMTRHYACATKQNWKGCMEASAQVTPIKPGMICRAPTIRERLRAVDYTRRNPAINKDLFKGEADWEWTSTLLANSDGSPSGCAWYVGCNDGFSGCSYQYGFGFVRAVCVSQ